MNHGLQLWAALPSEHEEAPPSFTHTPAGDIPELNVQGAVVRVLIGEAFGQQSPVATLSWLLSMAALPVVGLLIYYYFGPQRLQRHQRRRHHD